MKSDISLTPFNSITQTFEKIFGTIEIHVPDFQRSYTWEPIQTDALWNDLMEEWTEGRQSGLNTSFYFLGTIVATAATIQTGAALILDGQQRLATVTILLCSIRDALLKLGSKEAIAEADRLEASLLRTKLKNFILVLNTEDKDFFRRAIQEPVDAKAIKAEMRHKSHRLIWRAKLNYDKRCAELLKGKTPDDALKLLASLWLAIASQIAVVTVTVGSEDDAERVFEVLNDRGVELSVADLLRNFLIRQSPNNRSEVASRWDDLIKKFRGANLTSFLRHSWISRYSELTTKSAYRNMRAAIALGTFKVSPAGHIQIPVPKEQDLPEGCVEFTIDVTKFLDGIQQDAEAALNLQDDQLSPVAKIDTERSELIYGYRALRARQAHPLLFAVAECCPTALNPILEIVNTITMQISVTNGNPNEMEGVYSSLGRAVRNGLKPAEALSLVTQATLASAKDEADFENGFKEYEPSSGDLQRYVLWELEKSIDPKKGYKELALADPSTVHVEHIYPQNPKPGDRLLDHDDIVDRIGNLTLLSGPKNKMLQNKLINEKQATYAASGLKITSDLASRDEWILDNITERQAWLASVAKSIWKL